MMRIIPGGIHMKGTSTKPSRPGTRSIAVEARQLSVDNEAAGHRDKAQDEGN